MNLETLSKNENLNFTKDEVEKFDFPEVVCELRNLLKNYLSENKKLSRSNFCERNGIAKTTVHYILNEITQKKVSPEVARKIICGINRNKPLKDILQKTQGHLGAFLRSSSKSLTHVSFPAITSKEKQIYMKEREVRIMTLLAHTKGGTTRNKIAQTIDNFALETLDEMIKCGILIERADGIITGSEDHQYVDGPTTKKMIADLAPYMKPANAHEGYNKCAMRAYKLNKKQMEQVTDILTKATNDISKICSGKEDEAGKPYFIALASDTIEQPTFEGGGQQ